MLLIGVRHWYALEPPALLHSGTALASKEHMAREIYDRLNPPRQSNRAYVCVSEFRGAIESGHH